MLLKCGIEIGSANMIQLVAQTAYVRGGYWLMVKF